MNGFDPVQAHFDVADHLASSDYFAGIAVMAEQPRTLRPGATAVNNLDQIYSTVSGKGAGVIVMMPVLSGTTPNNPLYFNDVTFQVNALVSDAINVGVGGAAKRASEIAAQIALALHEWTAPPLFNNLIVKELRPVRLTELPEEIAAALFQSRIVMWMVTLTTQMELPTATKCASPTMTETGGTITLASTTGTAKIYYTTDGSYPGSSNTTATLYYAPFALTVACTVRAATQKTGLQTSNISQAAFTP